MNRSYTENELTVMRSKNQWSRWFLLNHQPAILFQARVNQAVFTWPLLTLAFDQGVDAEALPAADFVPADCMVWLGTAAGLRDRGQVRLRAAFDPGVGAGTLKLAELGEHVLVINDNDFITVVEDFQPQARYLKYDAGLDTWLLDSEIAYDIVDANEPAYHANRDLGPLSILGPAAVAFISSAVSAVARARYVGERSQSLTDGENVAAYAWKFPNATTSAEIGTRTDPVVVTYSDSIPDGRYHSLQVTESSTNKTHTGHRLTFVLKHGQDQGIPITLQELRGGFETGGARVQISIKKSDVPENTLRDGAHVVLYEEPHYGNWWAMAVDEFSISVIVIGTRVGGKGSFAIATVSQILTGDPEYVYLELSEATVGFENGEEIVGVDDEGAETELAATSIYIHAPAIGGNFPYRQPVVVDGWIIHEHLVMSADRDSVDFEIGTVDAVLDTMRNYSMSLAHRRTTPDQNWEDFKNLSLNRATFHYCRWRSTVSQICDIMLGQVAPVTTEFIKYLVVADNNQHEQLRQLWRETVIGEFACDFQSALYFELNPQIDEDQRAITPTVMELLVGDRRGRIEFDRRRRRQRNAQLTLYALHYKTSLGARTPNDPYDYLGVEMMEIRQGLECPDQATLNTWTANARANFNNEFKSVTLPLVMNAKIDPVPQSYVLMSLDGTETRRQLVWEQKRLLLREIRYDFNLESMRVMPTLTLEGETQAEVGATAITFPTPTPGPPPPVNTCDTGYHWDETTQACVRDTVELPVLTGDARYMWFAFDAITPNFGIAWGDVPPSGSQPPYHLVAALPTGLTTLHGFAVNSDGSILYVIATVTAKRGFWKCANPQEAAPTWTKILEAGDPIPNYESKTVHAANFGTSLAKHGNIITTFAFATDNSNFVLEYNGTTFTTYVISLGTYLDLYQRIGYRAWWHHGTQVVKALPSGTTIGTLDGGSEASPNIWQNLIGGHLYGIRYEGPTGGSYFLRDITAGTDIATLTDAAPQTRNSMAMGVSRVGPRGAYKGTEINYVDGYHRLWHSVDGVTASNVATWIRGIVEQTRNVGGGPLIWFPYQTSNANEIARISYNDGVDWDPITGNYWTAIQTDGQLFNLIDFQISF